MDALERDHRNRRIFARAAEDPYLTMADIGQEFELSTAAVSLILSGRRGGRKHRNVAAMVSVDPEIGAMSEILAIVDPLNDEQAKRVLLYALKRRCGLGGS